jgi:APA family basic amino acid/polyamine antiporter
VRDLFKPLVAILAATILLIAANAGLIGISRLAFFMGRREQIPSALRQIHPRFRTPYVSIVVFSLVAILILAPGFVSSNLYTDMGALYVFGSLLTFTAAHSSILSLRVKEPGLTHPFKLKGNIKVKGKEIPITALLGVIATLAVWAVIVIAQPYTRWVGFGWMGLGLLIYCCYRKKRRLSFTREAPGEIDLT